MTDKRGREQNWTEKPFRPWCTSDIYERKRNGKTRRASENDSDLTESLLTQLAALEQRLPVQGVPFWVEVAHHTQSLARGFLWMPRRNLKCYGWKLFAGFSPRSWMSSSFLKGDLSNAPPHLSQFGRPWCNMQHTWREISMPIARISKRMAYLVFSTLSTRILIMRVR